MREETQCLSEPLIGKRLASLPPFIFSPTGDLSKGLNMPRRYGFFRFLWDVILICLTGGLWLLWIVLRFLRRNTPER